MKVMILHESDGGSHYSSTYENDTDQSYCQSPVKNGGYYKSEVTVISPNKLKKFIQSQQADVLFQIECTKQQIIDNSPTKNSYIDNEGFLEFLHQKRVEHNKTKGHRKEVSNVIEKLRDQLRL